MEFNFAKKQVARISRNKIIVMLLIIAVTAGAVLAFAPSLSNIYLETATFTTAEEAEKLMKEGNNFVSLTADVIFDSGYESTENGKTVDKYYVYWAGEKYIICKVDKDLTQDEYQNYQLTGKLVMAEDTDADVISSLRIELAGYIESDQLASYIIDTKTSRLGTQVVVGIGGLLILIAIFQIFSAIISLADYKKNKFFKKMGVDIEAAERINENISNVYSQNMDPKEISGMEMNGDWIVDHSLMKFSVCKKEDILWIYKTITKHRTNGIPTGKSYSLVLKGKNNEEIILNVKNEKKADELMEDLSEEIPNVILGYTDELSALYEKDRAGFIALQERYRSEIEAAAMETEESQFN